jgi:hypothetical protein
MKILHPEFRVIWRHADHGYPYGRNPKASKQPCEGHHERFSSELRAVAKYEYLTRPGADNLDVVMERRMVETITGNWEVVLGTIEAK